MKYLSVILATIALTAVACQNPTSRENNTSLATIPCGSITVALPGGSASTESRTLVMDSSAISFSSYNIALVSHDGFPPQSVSVTGSSTTFTSVQAGTWDISIVGLSGSNALAAGNALNRVVVAGSNLNITIPLVLTQTGQGSFSLPISFPTATGIDYATASLIKIDGAVVGTPLVPSIATTGGTSQAIFSMANVASGSYNLRISFYRGGSSGTLAGVFGEAVNIYDNVLSNQWISPTSGNLLTQRDFLASEFFSTESNLANISLLDINGIIPPSPSFASGALSYSGFTYGPTISMTITGSLPGQSYQYQINGSALVSLTSGATISAIPIQLGSNILSVNVTAPDRSTINTYTTTITRLPITVNYFANGSGQTTGSVPIDGIYHNQGDTVTVMGRGSLVTTGFQFAGWMTNLDGTGTSYATGATFSFPSTTTGVNLYAIWVPNTAICSSSGTTIAITGFYSNQSGEFAIPVGVTNFNGVNATGQNLTSLIFPPSIVALSSGLSLGNVSSVTFTAPCIIPSFPSSAFSDFRSLSSITVPSSVTSIDTMAFGRCWLLSSIVIPETVTYLGSDVFNGDTALTSVTLPSTIVSIERGAFQSCPSLASISIPAGVSSIGDYAFDGCTSLTDLTVMAASPPALGSLAFRLCPPAMKIHVPLASLADYQNAPGWSLYNIVSP
jgi:hypothetical protein